MRFFYQKWNVLLILMLLLAACKKDSPSFVDITDSLFTSLPSQRTGIDFQNNLSYTEDFNPYTYRNFYNGGGVALGDINNDGLIDVYFCGNQVDNKLYLNKGNFQFEDITEKAGVACPGIWSTGVSMVDINGDGWLDIYVCKSGKPEGERRYNELFINNGDLTFTEQAKEYGLADLGLSSHAVFFDYDKDGDLDCYLLNNSIRSVGGYDLIKDQRKIPDPQGGNKLYRNDDNKFVNVSQEAGIYSSAIGFGLGVTIGDVNRDGWQDIYVSNDFFEKDYLYINQKDGTFKESLEDYIRELSLSSMGADMADLNNDGYPEIFVTDMLPEDEARLKTKTTFDNWNKYQLNVQQGYYKQFTRNVLQLNLGERRDRPDRFSKPVRSVTSFIEIGRLAGVHATDWSWGALIFDLNNDGYKDIFVANGIYKDLTDQDYINFYSDPNTIRAILSKEKAVIQRMIDTIPSEAVSNYAFINNGMPDNLAQASLQQLQFTNKAKELGLGEPSFSNGSAYGDLDNDGDLDLVVNNVAMPAFIYRNNSDTLLQNNHFLVIELKGDGKNTRALGAQVQIRHSGKTFYQELAPMRGFQSCVDTRLHFGLGNLQQVDSLIVTWNDGRMSLLTNVPTNQFLKIDQKEASNSLEDVTGFQNLSRLPTIFKEQKAPDFQHVENDFSDFDRDRLIYHMLSTEGPKMAKGDVNGDGREDFYIGGAKDQTGKLFIQTADNQFKSTNEALFEQDKLSEDTDALFFDADGDGDQDLYVCSGGNEFPNSSSALASRLYLNNGKGNFTKSPQILPSFNFESTSCVQSLDYDKDEDLDLFVGVRLRPFLYGVPCNGYILQNNGKGQFNDVTATVAPQLLNIGMITDALASDYDKDGDADLIIVGEYMPITIFQNNNGNFTNITQIAGLAKTNGFWHSIAMGDFDGDGDLDFVAGNQGLNTRIKASPEKPVTMYINDFDQNGTAEQILCTYNGDESYPITLRHDLVAQMPGLKKKYLKYASYKNQTITDIFTPEQLQKAVKLEAYESQSCIMINNGDGSFTLKPLPALSQLSCVYGLLVQDFDGDKNLDILMGGNFYRAKPEIGINDASYGLFLKGDGKGNFTPQLPGQSGFFVKGEIRDLIDIKLGTKKAVLVAKNNDYLQLFEY